MSVSVVDQLKIVDVGKHDQGTLFVLFTLINERNSVVYEAESVV